MKRWLKAGLQVLPFALILSSIYGLEYFGRMRMGMMRYLVFMKRQFDNGFFTPGNLQLLTLLVLSLAVLAALMSLGFKFGKSSGNSEASQGKKTSKTLWRYWLLTLLIALAWLVLPPFKGWLSYHFDLIGWLVLAGTTGLVIGLKALLTKG